MEQPFKYITIVIKEQSADMRDFITREIAHAKGWPVYINDDGYGSLISNGSKKEKPIIGILMETFPQPYCQSKVLVHGITPMRADNTVKAGRAVFWDATKMQLTGIKPKNTVGKSEAAIAFVGTALQTSKAEQDKYAMVDIFIK